MLFQFKFDGACNNHDKFPSMGIAVAVFIDGTYYEDLSIAKGVQGDTESSSNIAEWMSCVEAFKLSGKYIQSDDTIEIYSDSMLISSQYNGNYSIKQQKFVKYYNEAKELAKQAGLQDLKIQWVKREFNKEADKLSKIGLKSIPNGKAKEHQSIL